MSVTKFQVWQPCKKKGSFNISSCCRCHTIKPLFCGMGNNPTVYELDEDPRGKDLGRALIRLLGISFAVLVVFINGKLVVFIDGTTTLLFLFLKRPGLSGSETCSFS
ncbi:hypothetical protein ACFXTI_005367 [Malus domestica]